MAPHHEFLLLEEGVHPYREYMRHLHSEQALKVDDDVLQYLGDTLRWIPTRNPADVDAAPRAGLCWYGPTIVNREGAAEAARVFDGWRNLFAAGPAELELALGGQPATRRTFPRDPLLVLLGTLADWSRRAETGRNYILHLGL